MRQKTSIQILKEQQAKQKAQNRKKPDMFIPLAIGERFTLSYFTSLYRDHYPGAADLPKYELYGAAADLLWSCIGTGKITRSSEKAGFDQSETGVEVFQIVKKIQIQ